MADDNDRFIIEIGETGAQETVKVLQELQRLLKNSENVDRSSTERTDSQTKSFWGLTKGIFATIGAYALLKKAIGGVFSNADKGLGLKLEANFAGVTTKYLEGLGNALKLFGGNARDAARLITSLTANLAGLDFGEGGALEQAMMRYGLKIFNADGSKKTAEELELEIADTYMRLSSEHRVAFASLLGITKEQTAMYEKGRESVLRYRELVAKYTLNDEDREKNAELAKASNEAQMAWTQAWEKFTADISPELTKTINSLRMLAPELSQLVEPTKKLIGIFTDMLEVLKYFTQNSPENLAKTHFKLIKEDRENWGKHAIIAYGSKAAEYMGKDGVPSTGNDFADLLLWFPRHGLAPIRALYKSALYGSDEAEEDIPPPAAKTSFIYDLQRGRGILDTASSFPMSAWQLPDASYADNSQSTSIRVDKIEMSTNAMTLPALAADIDRSINGVFNGIQINTSSGEVV